MSEAPAAVYIINVGMPILISPETKWDVPRIDFGSVNVPAGTHRLRWIPLNLGNGEINTDSDYFAINDLSFHGRIVGGTFACDESWCETGNKWAAPAGGAWDDALNWQLSIVPNGSGVAVLVRPRFVPVSAGVRRG